MPPRPRIRGKIDAPNPTLVRDKAERAKLKRAIFLAPRVYPGPAGELLVHELTAWDEAGWRFGGFGLIRRVVDDILTKAGEKQNGRSA